METRSVRPASQICGATPLRKFRRGVAVLSGSALGLREADTLVNQAETGGSGQFLLQAWRSVVLQSFAVSVLTEKPPGDLRHTLCIVEAGSLDAAEAHVLHRLTQVGHIVRGLLSRGASLTEEMAFVDDI